MKIAIDGGGLCPKKTNRYGNYVFSKNCIQALSQYEKKNAYYVYSFCKKPDWFPNNFIHKQLVPKQLWMNIRVTLEEILKPKNIFLAFNQAIPSSSNAKIISFSHGLSFCYFPHLYQKSYNRLSRQLKRMIERSSWVVVSSTKVKAEINDLFPNYKQVVVSPFGIPLDMSKTEGYSKKKYFMFVGMNHPIKNVDFIIRAFEEFIKEKKYSQFKLKLVGNFKKYSHYKNVESVMVNDRKRLKQLYQQATGYLAASFYESFNLPVLEALSQNCPVIGLQSAIIPELSQYVQIGDNYDSFIKQMMIVADKKNKIIPLSEVKKFFSWEKYVYKLISLYD